MKKTYTILGIIIAIIILVMIFLFIKQTQRTTNPRVVGEESAVNIVTKFGKAIQKVPLTADEDTVKNTIKKEYAPYVTKGLLNKWLDDPISAPGREVSSPWPDHIEITQTRKIGHEYQINGNIIYISSSEVENGGDAGKRAISAIVYIYQDKPLITDFMMETLENTSNASTTSNDVDLGSNTEEEE